MTHRIARGALALPLLTFLACPQSDTQPDLSGPDLAGGQRVTLQQVDDLPPGSHADDIVIDTALHFLAAAAEAAGHRPAHARRSQGAS